MMSEYKEIRFPDDNRKQKLYESIMYAIRLIIKNDLWNEMNPQFDTGVLNGKTVYIFVYTSSHYIEPLNVEDQIDVTRLVTIISDYQKKRNRNMVW